MINSRSKVDEKIRMRSSRWSSWHRTLCTWMILSPFYRILRMIALLDARIILSLSLFVCFQAEWPQAQAVNTGTLSLLLTGNWKDWQAQRNG
jgi:hypothetical protein